MHSSMLAPQGALSLKVVRPQRIESLFDLLQYGYLEGDLPAEVKRWRIANLPNLWRGWRRVWMARKLGIPHFYGSLSLVAFKRDGRRLDYGLASLRVVTDVGVGFIVDAFQNIVELEIMKYHGIGTGGAAEAVGNTTLTTELTTQYQTDNTRATGTTAEGASANIYQTVATNTVDAGVAITEHGIFSVAASGAGVLLDRSLFSAVNLASGESIQSTYSLTLTSGG